MQLDEGELRGSVDCDQQVELALRGSDFGDVEMKIADWIGLEFALGGGFAFDLREPGNPMAFANSDEGTSASDAGWSAVKRRGSRRAATGYAFGTPRRRLLPRRTRPSIWVPSVPSARPRPRSALPLGDR